MANAVTGSFTSAGPAPSDKTGTFFKDFNITVSGTFTGTIIAERSFDAGLTWVPYTYIDGSSISWTAPFSTTVSEPENGVKWRLNATSMTGTANYRLSQ